MRKKQGFTLVELAIVVFPEPKPDIEATEKKQKGLETKLERIEKLTGINPCLCAVRKTKHKTCKVSKNAKGYLF